MWTYLPPSPIYTRSINCRVLFSGYRFLHESRFFLDWGYKRTRSVHEDRCRVSRHLYSVWYKCTRSVHFLTFSYFLSIIFQGCPISGRSKWRKSTQKAADFFVLLPSMVYLVAPTPCFYCPCGFIFAS